MSKTIHGIPARRLLAVLIALASCASCDSSSHVSNAGPHSSTATHLGAMAGPPIAICGKTLSTSPAGPVVNDASLRDLTITSTTVGDVIFLRVASDCDSGADIAIEPGDAASIVNDVRASDGRYVVVVLRPQRNAFTVRVTHSPTFATLVTVQNLSVETSMTTP